MADHLELPDPWEYEIAGMLSQVGTVTLPTDTLDKLLSGYDLEDHEAELFDNHPSVTEHLLERIPKLEEVAEMVGGQMNAFEPEVMGNDIRLEPRSTTGAHLLSVAVDFDLAVSRGLEPKEALADLSERAEDYDPRILDALAAIEIIPPKQVSRMAKLDDLATGMIIEEDIESQEGVVLISKGQEVNFTTIERLRRFKDDRGLIEPFKVTVRI
jgi:HD-GYP domain-containing protein (c-di-GMP phosphodiesterase class II)